MNPWLAGFANQDESALYNAAFGAVVIRRCAEAYAAEISTPMPVSLAFIAVPAALSRQIREAFPITKSTSLLVWAEAHERHRVLVQRNATALAPSIRTSLILGCNSELFTLRDNSIIPGAGTDPKELRRVSKATDEIKEILKVAERLGKSFSRSGDAASIFAIWGIVPQ